MSRLLRPGPGLVRHLLAAGLGLAAFWGAGCGHGGPEAARPNILLIVVDTLRFDHLGAYGYRSPSGLPTSPEIDARLAARGVVAERAYSQAPWTLPSMASMHTGRRAEEMLDAKGLPFGIPEPAATLAEQLQAAGYETAAFIANPTLHRGNGFAQGFATFETAPYDIASMSRHADDVNAGALPWLRQRQETGGAGKPFFLYLHYLDPHDPYDNSEIVAGKSPFFPEYQGRLRGTDVHGLYLGAVAMADPEQDLKQLKALYDSEVHYVDRRIGEVLAAFSPETLASTLVVLTADHGEELFDHGGYKHGETLYEELIHVPLIFRWDGKLPAGSRLAGTARLLDLWPTILAAAGPGGAPPAEATAEPADLWPREGIDLLPALAGGNLADLPAFARHFAGGPLRLARVLGGRKEILFDRHGPVVPADEQEKKLWQRDVARLARHELYDLAADPHEQNNLAAAGEAGNPGELLAELDPWLDGIRLMTANLAGCKLVEGEIEVAGEKLAARPLFLAPEDRWELEGGKLAFRWRGENPPKGVLLQGRAEKVTAARASCDGAALPFALGSGAAPPAGPPYELRALLVPKGERAAATATGAGRLGLWLRRPASVIGGERDEETRRRLKALGYTG